MSGIYIKGMEMPTDNTVLLRIFPASENGECYTQQIDIDGDILAELWAVPVPPHGRLIDADALMKHKGDCYDANGHLLYAIGTGNIMCAPTIIPAEEGE